jgi:hypothetical protein
MHSLFDRNNGGIIMVSKQNLVGISLLVLLVTACGSADDSTSQSGSSGPSYNGVTTQATIDNESANSLAVAATDATNNGDNQEQMGAVFSNVFNNLQNQKGGITAQSTVSGNCGGTATYPDNLNQQQNPISGTVSFSSYCIDGGAQVGQLVVSGQISFTADVQDTTLVSMSIELTDLMISYNGNTITTNSTLTYADSTVTFATSTDFYGSQGKTLRVKNLVISGSPDTGITITGGQIYEPDYGYVEIQTTENLVFQGCDNGKPNSGTLLLTGSGDSTASITFSCASYEVCVNGSSICDMYDW